MMKSRRDNIKSPHRKNNLGISRPLSRLNKATLLSSTSSASPSANIRVVVRVRPPNVRESGDNQKVTIKVVDENLLIFDPKENSEPFFYHGVQQKTRDFLRKTEKDIQFVFNRVFDWNVQNVEVFENSTKPLINSLMDGINCSVFAYGATGSGKTHTMLGNPSNPGITFLTMQKLFETKETLSIERDFELGITYLEVYNEIVRDLLNPGTTLTLREDSKFGVVVAGIKYVLIGSANELYNLLEEGNRNRTQHPTDANAESSRSHAVFQVYLKMKFKVSGEIRMAKLSMIDLAGSERGSATGFQGARFAEGANINKSLLALGNCINSLADGQRHVPYRDSKLTRLLKDSLGGNCQTVMIANISPSSLSYEDTYNTLRYATRAKAIKATIKRNVVNIDLKVEQYAKINEELNRELARLKAELKELREEKPKNVCVEVDPSILSQIEDIFSQRKNIIERTYSMEISEQIVQLRSQVKEDANSRLSGLCCDTPDKEERHRKLDNTIYRCNRQKETFRDEISALNAEKTELEMQTGQLLEQHPSLKLTVELKELELAKLEEQFKNQINLKQIKIYQEEMQHRGDLIEKMSSVLKPCFMQLRAMGYATDNLIQEYEAVLSHSQGTRNIKWQDEVQNPVPDSGVCSTTTIIDDNAGSALSVSPTHSAIKSPARTQGPELEMTFTVNSVPRKAPIKSAKKKVCAESLLVKAYKPSPMKKARVNSASLKMKENIPSSRAIHAQKFQIRKGLESASSRPPFRR
ncbi:hypothetical protein HHI36_020449 [Cryptolaemus montrouzieri]|uniref:Kinesin-like protein n=1 Tax=Cryptolaemus montrouzieri TaxID=559131 RepID=A0ABD2NAZ1_9CUCU